MDIADYKFVRLETSSLPKNFDCGDEDLNSFYTDASVLYAKSLLAVTYTLETKDDGQSVAFFSLLNDKISISDFPSKRKYWAFAESLRTLGKGFNSYPSLKIGRFAVHKEFQKQGVGVFVLDFIKTMFIRDNRTGCKYITVDAYKSATPFYERNGFKYLSDTDKESDTRLMYFDLIQLI